MGEEEKDEIIEEEEEAPQEEPSGRRFELRRSLKYLYVAGGHSAHRADGGDRVRLQVHAGERLPEAAGYRGGAAGGTAFRVRASGFSKTTADAEPHFIKMKIFLAYESNMELNTELVSRRSRSSTS